MAANRSPVPLLDLTGLIPDDRYPLSRRIRTLQGILDKLDPPPVREPLPPLKVYAPPRAKSSQRRGRRKRRSLGCLLVEWRVNHFLSARFAPRRSCSCQTQTGHEDSYR
jgi:hypothetical protein